MTPMYYDVRTSLPACSRAILRKSFSIWCINQEPKIMRGLRPGLNRIFSEDEFYAEMYPEEG